MPFLFETPGSTLRLISTTNVFGSPVDLTLKDLTLEAFFPGDEATAGAARAMVATMPA